VKKKNWDSEKRRRYIIFSVCLIVLIYIAQLFRLQIVDEDYKQWADSNAFLNRKIYPPRGVIYDRNGKLLVYNQPTYDVMVTFRQTEKFDTLAFCNAVNISIESFYQRLDDVRNRRLNPGYSSYTPQTFLTQLSNKEYGVLQESIYKFPGFYIESRTVREYDYANAAHVLGYTAEVSRQELADDDYYVRGDYIGKSGIERYYERHLRGTKGVEVLLRDARGRIVGKYENGSHDEEPIAGKDLTLSIDIELQAYGEALMQNKLGSIIMIEPKTGEILCMVSSPSYDPSLLTGKQFGEGYMELARDPYKPLVNLALGGTYPPGSTFKPAQALVFLDENIIQPNTAYPCYYGFPLNGGRPGCRGHVTPISLIPSIGHSCNSYYCYGLKAMLENGKYGSIQNAMNRWRDLMVAQGFGRPLGVDLPSESRGFIPNADFYDRNIGARWNPFNVISISIGQGEIVTTPLQLCNFAATIANRGYYYVPHIVREIKDTPLNSTYTQRIDTGIDTEHYETIAEGMQMAVTGGSAWRAAIPNITVCGKTGTSENIGRDHALFIAFAPKDDPEVAIAVIVENGGFGGQTAVPIARLMMEKYLNGTISESSQWMEETIKQTVILRNVLPKK
jgi:penicillin-binding protein 2